jgi:hypothetical protein
MSHHKDYKFSITIRTDDLAVVYCLRALAKYSQKTGNNQIPWGGTKNSDWERDGHSVKFRFSKSEYRAGFLAEAKCLLPAELWSMADHCDNDPASPQS